MIPNEPDVPAGQALLVCTAGRGFFTRLVAHVLIRLLSLTPLPPQLRLGAALFPLLVAWPSLASIETAPEPSQKTGEREAAQACVLRLSDPFMKPFHEVWKGYRTYRLLFGQ